MLIAGPLESAPDDNSAIAVRIIDNPNHYSSLRWYQIYGSSGPVQNIKVDGYDAVRSGRTVYVDAANIIDSDGDQKPDSLHTYIFLLSYSQTQYESSTEIFDQLLKNFKFNDNLSGSGVCSHATESICNKDGDCPEGEYCQSEKAKVIRDVKRLADLADLQAITKSYVDKNGHYPEVSSGTYVSGRSLSVWPSWQDSLADELGVKLPVDPINKLGDCPGFASETCWNPANSRFAADIADGILPSGSHAYMYLAGTQSISARFCAQMESDYQNIKAYDCFEDRRKNSQPVIKDVSLYGWPKREFVGYANVHDADGDSLHLKVEPVEPALSEWISQKWDLSSISVTTQPGSGQMKIVIPVTGNAHPAGYYKVRLVLDDGRGEDNSVFSKIYDLTVMPQQSEISQASSVVVIGQTDSDSITGTDSNGDAIDSLYFDSASYNGQPITQAELSESGFTLSGTTVYESYQPKQRTGIYGIKVYASDSMSSDGRIYSSFSYKIIDNPPALKQLTANFGNGEQQICEPGSSCNLEMDNGEKMAVGITAQDPDGHPVSYSLIQNPEDSLAIGQSSGVIRGFEKLNYHNFSDKDYKVGVRISDPYCNNSSGQECSVDYYFNVKVVGYCSVDFPESMRYEEIKGPFSVLHSGDDIVTGLSIDDCSSVGTSTMDVKFVGESHSQDIVLVSDLSSSMDADVVVDGSAKSAISRLKSALTAKDAGFLDRVYGIASSLLPQYAIRVGLIGYNGTIVNQRSLTNLALPGAVESIKNSINSYATYYQTNTLLALNTAETILNDTLDPEAEKIIILMSDGIPGVDGWSISDPLCYTPSPSPVCSSDLPSCPTGQIQIGCTSSYCYSPSCSCGGDYPDCTPPASCPTGQIQGGCTPDDCYTPPHSSFNRQSFFRRLISSIFPVPSASAMTTQNECIYKSCQSAFPNYSCSAGQQLFCNARYPVLDCDLTPDVNKQAQYLKGMGISLYTIYYNTSNTLDPEQRMCNWSSNDGLDCGNNTYAFSGSDIDSMINRVLGRIVAKPKDVVVASSPIVDNDVSSTTSFVDDAPVRGLSCGAFHPRVTYSNTGHLEFSDIKINYCAAKLHP